MAKERGRKTTRLDGAAVVTGSALGELAAKIDSLSEQRDSISAEIRQYVRQAQGALRGLSSGENLFPFGRKVRTQAATKPRRKMTAKARKAISDARKLHQAKTKETATKAYAKAKKSAS